MHLFFKLTQKSICRLNSLLFPALIAIVTGILLLSGCDSSDSNSRTGVSKRLGGLNAVILSPANGTTLVFTKDENGVSTTAVRCSAAASGGKEPYGYSWQVAGGKSSITHSDEGDGNTVTIHFLQTGRYEIQMTATDSNRLSGYDAVTINVVNP